MYDIPSCEMRYTLKCGDVLKAFFAVVVQVQNNNLKTFKKNNNTEAAQGFLTDCTLYAQFSEDQNSIFKP